MTDLLTVSLFCFLCVNSGICQTQRYVFIQSVGLSPNFVWKVEKFKRTQPAFIYPKSTMETPEEHAKSFQS